MYVLTWLPVGEMPPTNDWKRVRPKAPLPTQDIKSSNVSETENRGRKPAGRCRVSIGSDTGKTPITLLENRVIEPALNNEVGGTTA